MSFRGEWRGRLVGALTTTLLLAACQPAASTGPTADVPVSVAATEPSPAPTSSSTPTELDPYAVPDDPADIDAAYVESVLEALSQSYADATREVVEHGRITRRAKAAIAATHSPEAAHGTFKALMRVLRRDPTGAPLNPAATPADILVEDLISVGDGCIFVKVLQNTNGLVTDYVKPFESYYYLERNKAPRRSPLNATPWIIEASAQPRSDGMPYNDPCL